jgi:DNA replication protein DnaC
MREAQAAARGMSVPEWEATLAAEQERGEAERRGRLLELAHRLAQQRTEDRLTCRSSDVAMVSSGAIEDTEALCHVRGWLEGTQPALVLCGGVGTGKTTAAAWAAWTTEHASLLGLAARLLEPGQDRESASAKLRSMPCQIEAVRALLLGRRADPWKQDLAAGVQPLNFGAELLVLDDLGTERPDDARFAEGLFRLIDERQDQDHRTLITTNLRRADIRPRYGDRIADRLNHIGRAVEIKGASMRRKGDL